MSDFIINLSNNRIPLSGGDKISFKLIIKNSFYDAIEEHLLIDFGNLELGNDDENENVFYPGNIDIEFLFDVDDNKYEYIIYELKSKTTIAQLFYNETKIFSGYVSTEDVSGNKYSKIIKLTIIDQFKRLEDYNTLNFDNTPMFNYQPSHTIRIIDLIKDLLSRQEIYEDPIINEVVNLLPLEVYVNELGWVDFTSFATKIYKYFNPKFENCLKVLKTLLIQFGCLGIIGLDNKFYIYPKRYYQGAPVYQINKKNIISEEINIIPKKPGLIINLYRFNYPDYYNIKQEFQYTGFRQYRYNEKEKDKYESIDMVELGSMMLMSDNDYMQSLIINSIPSDYIPLNYRIKKSDGTYYENTVLYILIFNYIWDYIHQDRKEYKLEISGNIQDINFSKYYYFEDNPNIFYRLRKAQYNFKNNTVKITLIDATNIETAPTPDIIIYDLIDAENAKIEGDLIPIPDIITDVWRIKSEKLYAVFDNFFASNPATVKLYNGTIVNIPLEQRTRIANSVKNYVVYIAVSKNNNPPQYNYPNKYDSEADWYFFDYMSDQKIYLIDYKYKWLLPEIKLTEKKIYFWLGIQLKTANLIPGIKQYPYTILRTTIEAIK